MSGLIYHLAEPEAKKSFYSEFDNIDMNLSVGEGRVLVKNSVRLIGELQIRDNGARPTNDGILFDNKIGVHSFVDSVQVSFLDGPNAGSKENIQNYARYAAMAQVATSNPEDALNGSELCELKGYDERTTNLFVRGRTTRNTNTPQTDLNQDFSMKPMCILNKMSGGNLSYSKSGVIRLTLNLAPNRSALYGGAAGGNGYNPAEDDYRIVNPRLIYQSLPDSGKEGQVLMRSVFNVKNAILSNFSNTQVRVPSGACDACSVSFQRIDKEQKAPFNNYQLERVKGFEEIQFLFNDSTNEYVSYIINDETEFLHRGVNSFVDTGHNQLSIPRFNDNQSFIGGLGFNGFVNLSNQKFSVQLKSKIDNTTGFNIYMYFHSLMSM
jgi:hypothetical protein